MQDAQWFQSKCHREPHYVLEISAVLPPDDAHPLLCDTACGAQAGLGVGGRQPGLTVQLLLQGDSTWPEDSWLLAGTCSAGRGFCEET